MLRDEQDARRVNFYPSHTVGCGATTPSSIEFMFARSMAQDDGRGLSEAVQDTSRVELSLWITIDWSNEDSVASMSSASAFMSSSPRHFLRLNNPPLLFYRPSGEQSIDWTIDAADNDTNLNAWNALMRSTLSFMSAVVVAQRSQSTPLVSAGLPSDIHLFSLEPVDAYSDDVIVRLQHLQTCHSPVGEDVDDDETRVRECQMEREIAIRLDTLLDDQTLINVRETTLAANQRMLRCSCVFLPVALLTTSDCLCVRLQYWRRQLLAHLLQWSHALCRHILLLA